MLLCLVAATALASPQLDCGPRSAFPSDMLDAIGFAPTVSQFGQLKLDGDLLIGCLRDQVSPGDAAIFLHRRSAVGGDWLTPERIAPVDLGATRFGGQSSRFDYAVAGGTVFIPALMPTGWHVAALEYVGDRWDKVAEFQGEADWGQPTTFESTGFGVSVWLAADGDRLVVGAPDVTLPSGQGTGAIVTYERTASGGWATSSVTEGTSAYVGGARRVDLDGDRMALIHQVFGQSQRAAVLEWSAAGWAETWVSEPLESCTSLALDGERVIVGTYYDAETHVYDSAAAAGLKGGAPIQIIPANRALNAPPSGAFTPRDYNPPYDAFVEAEAGFAVVGIGDDFFGWPTVTTLEWLDGRYRPIQSTRTQAGTAGVALSDGEVVLLAPPRTQSSDQIAETRFESWRVDDGRAVPFCDGPADLLLSGSGAAPFNGGFVTAYALEPASLLVLFGGLSAGVTPLSMGQELCIDSATLVRLGAPMLAGSDGSLRVPSVELQLEGLAPALIAGGTFYMQASYREPVALGGEIGTTNAVRATLCQ